MLFTIYIPNKNKEKYVFLENWNGCSVQCYIFIKAKGFGLGLGLPTGNLDVVICQWYY